MSMSEKLKQDLEEALQRWDSEDLKPSTDNNILDDADKLTSKDRREDYGDALDCCQKIADMWSVIANKVITAEQVSLMMIALKIVRELQSSKRDNIVDIAGYARVLDMCKQKTGGWKK